MVSSKARTWLNAGLTSFKGKIGLIFLFLLLVLPAFAAGGACPSGANYTNPSNPTGSLVTLASLGITSCYYVSAAGSDSSYNGTQETVSGSRGPFQHAPGMPNCSSNCSDSLLVAGVGIIFRGGDTWHTGNSALSPYTGYSGGCTANTGIQAALCTYAVGTSSNPIYFGVDQAWFAGGSWARPIFNADNPLCNASTANGTTCVATTDWYGQPSYYVTSCPYQTGTSNNIIDMTSAYYEIIDNLELTGLCQSHVGQPAAADVYLRYGSASAPVYFTNNYLHGASHLQFAAKNGSSGCTESVVCTNIFAFSGSVTGTAVGETAAKNVADFSDSDPGGQGLCYGGFYNVAYNTFRYTTQCLPGTLHIFHDNLYEYFFENGHSNMVESNDIAGTNAIYNNVFRHVETYVKSGGGVALWFGPATGATDYLFNNVMYDVGRLEYLNNGGVALTTIEGNYVWFNNTFQSNVGQYILGCNGYTNGTVKDTNNHYIDDNNYLASSGCALTTTTPLWQSNTSSGSAPSYSNSDSSTHFDQYTSGGTYAYSPVASTNSTVGAGTNEGTINNAYCSALSTAASSDPTLSDAATACPLYTTYACSYNTSNHTVSCPGQTPNARPSGGAWDIGAYQSSAQGQPPNPPTGLTAVVQ